MSHEEEVRGEFRPALQLAVLPELEASRGMTLFVHARAPVGFGLGRIGLLDDVTSSANNKQTIGLRLADMMHHF